ncbi:MAG: hypothetical protein ABI220_03555 [Candidatus Saccharimonadales bacterium]
MAKKTNNTFSSQYPSGIAFVGSIIIGTGVGMLTNRVGAFSTLGVGVGFILVAILSSSSKNRPLDR